MVEIVGAIRTFGLGLSVLAGTFLVSCNYRLEKSEMGESVPPTFASVQRFILLPKCAGCHTGSGSPKGVDLSNYQAIFNSKQVVSKNPESSPLFISVTQGSMPKGMDRLRSNEIELLRRWIELGALEGEVEVVPPPEPTYAWIKKYVFEVRCNNCHDGKHEKTKLDLRSYESMMAYEGEFMKAVEPGDPDFSLIYRSTNEGIMPPRSDKLSSETIQAISTWIAQGAKEKS